MRNNTFERNLRRVLQQVPIMNNDTHYKNTLLLSKKEAGLRLGQKRISFSCFLWRQIRFMGFKLWIIQGIFLFIINRILSYIYGYLLSPHNLIKVLFCLSVLVFMTILPLIYRSVCYQMQEIEAASRFSCTKLLLAKLIVIGLGDLTILSGIFFTTMVQTSLSADSALLYLCFPFLLAGSGCLFMLGHFTPRHFLMGSLSFCTALVLVFCVIPRQYAFWFRQSFSAMWIGICALLLVCCISHIRGIIKSSAFTEIQVS